VDLGEMQRLTIEKLEELTLYILELKESNEALNAENEALRARIEALEN
jgi:FtsZ-binding cell division protein ZapB